MEVIYPDFQKFINEFFISEINDKNIGHNHDVEIVYNYWPFYYLMPFPFDAIANLFFLPISIFTWPTWLVWNFIPRTIDLMLIAGIAVSATVVGVLFFVVGTAAAVALVVFEILFVGGLAILFLLGILMLLLAPYILIFMLLTAPIWILLGGVLLIVFLPLIPLAPIILVLLAIFLIIFGMVMVAVPLGAAVAILFLGALLPAAIVIFIIVYFSDLSCMFVDTC